MAWVGLGLEEECNSECECDEDELHGGAPLGVVVAQWDGLVQLGANFRHRTPPPSVTHQIAGRLAAVDLVGSGLRYRAAAARTGFLLDLALTVRRVRAVCPVGVPMKEFPLNMSMI